MQHNHAIRSWTVLSLLLGAVCLLGISPSAQADELRKARETFQVAQLQVAGVSPPVLTLGAARLNRTRNELWATLHASDLAAHTAYTVWVTVFNRPDACTTNPGGEVQCGAPDIMATPNLARASAFNVGAFLTNGDGTANISVHVRSGPVPEGAAVLFGAGGMNDNGVRPGLRVGNGFGAEVHVVIRGHGDLLPEAIVDQLSAFLGGCPPNACANAQVVMFPHVQD